MMIKEHVKLNLEKFNELSKTVEASLSFGMIEYSRFERLKEYVLSLPVCSFVDTEFETGDPGDEHAI